MTHGNCRWAYMSPKGFINWKESEKHTNKTGTSTWQKPKLFQILILRNDDFVEKLEVWCKQMMGVWETGKDFF